MTIPISVQIMPSLLCFPGPEAPIRRAALDSAQSVATGERIEAGEVLNGLRVPSNRRERAGTPTG